MHLKTSYIISNAQRVQHVSAVQKCVLVTANLISYPDRTNKLWGGITELQWKIIQFNADTRHDCSTFPNDRPSPLHASCSLFQEQQSAFHHQSAVAKVTPKIVSALNEAKCHEDIRVWVAAKYTPIHQRRRRNRPPSQNVSSGNQKNLLT
jgi:hypothetical protein